MYNPLFESILSQAKEYKPLGIYESNMGKDAQRYVSELIFSESFKTLWNFSVACPNVKLKDELVKSVVTPALTDFINPTSVEKILEKTFSTWASVYGKAKQSKITEDLIKCYDKANQGMDMMKEAFEACKKGFGAYVEDPKIIESIKAKVLVYQENMKEKK